MRMKAPENCDHVNWDGERFDVEKDGTVSVPDEAASTLVSHGFAIIGGDEADTKTQATRRRGRPTNAELAARKSASSEGSGEQGGEGGQQSGEQSGEQSPPGGDQQPQG